MAYAIKSSPNCTICKLPPDQRQEVDHLLEIRSTKRLHPVFGRVTGRSILQALQDRGITLKTERSLNTHWAKHCSPGGMPLGSFDTILKPEVEVPVHPHQKEADDVASGVSIAHVATAGQRALAALGPIDGRITSDEALRRMLVVGWYELCERIEHGRSSGVTPDQMVRLSNALQRSSGDESIEDWMNTFNRAAEAADAAEAGGQG